MAAMAAIFNFVSAQYLLNALHIPLKLTGCIWPIKGNIPFENQLHSFFNIAAMSAILNFVSAQ